jgi:hypothetical protein
MYGIRKDIKMHHQKWLHCCRCFVACRSTSIKWEYEISPISMKSTITTSSRCWTHRLLMLFLGPIAVCQPIPCMTGFVTCQKLYWNLINAVGATLVLVNNIKRD